MAGYDIRTMTGHEVLLGMVKVANPKLNFKSHQVTFTNVTASPISGRPGRTNVTMAAAGYRGTVLLTYGRVDISAGIGFDNRIELYSDDTQVELIAKINSQYDLNLGADDYVIEEGPLHLDGSGQRDYTLSAAPGSYAWYGTVVLDLLFGSPRLMEDGSLRLMEDGSVRMLEE